jgi:hypothetical protein
MNLRETMLAVGLGVAICSCQPQIDTPPKKVIVDDTLGHVSFQGSWRAIAQLGFAVIPTINTTSGQCWKQTMQCTESIAMLFRKSDNTLDKGTWLNVQVDTYQVVEWTSTSIYAKEEATVNDIELRISLKDQSAERFSRETQARGASTANPEISRHWILAGKDTW